MIRRGLFVKNILRKIFFEDWLTKLVALAVTFALWLGVTGLSTPTTTRLTGIPLSLRFSSDTEVTNTPITEVDIIVSGDNRKIAQINKNDLVASVDLTGVALGDRVIQLTPANVQLELPLGVRLDEITPSRMAVRLEAVEEREVPVKVETEGTLAAGCEIYSTTVTPPRIRVRGPVSITRALSQIATEKIDLTGRSEDFTARQVSLIGTSAKTTLLETVVDVAFRIGERRVERLFVVPLYDNSGRRASVLLYGPRTALSELNTDDIRVQNSKSEAGADTPQVTLPAALHGLVEVRRVRLN